MDLVERYLVAVAPLLPIAQRADILAELRDSLLSQLDERREQLGREPNADEVEALLKAFGHPMAVARAYRQPWQFIGPEIGPWYQYAVTAWLGLGLVVSLIAGVVSFAHGATALGALASSAVMLWQSVIWGLGTLTFMAMVLERLGAGQWLARTFKGIVALWQPSRDLPRPVPRDRAAAQQAILSSVRIGTTVSTVVFDLVGLGLLALWFSGAAAPLLEHLPGLVHWRPSSIVLALPLPLLLLAVLQTVADLLALRGVKSMRLHLALRAVVKVGALGILFTLLPHWPWVEAVSLSPTVAPLLMNTLNVVLAVCWVLVTAMTVFALVWNAALLRPRAHHLKTH